MRRLLIRPGAIGDCILAFPALEHLIEDYTEVWVPLPVVPLVRFASAVYPLMSTSINLLGVGDLEAHSGLRARLQSFDSIVSWYGSNRPEFCDALASINPKCQFHAALPPADYAGHAIDFFAQQAGAPLGLVPLIEPKNVFPRNSIAIHPFSGSKSKNWPLEQYRDLVDRLVAQLGCEVDWLAGPEEELKGAKRFDDLSDLGAFIAGARLYVGNDSGITHLAAAVGVKTLALFGPTRPETWAPRASNVSVVRGSPLEHLDIEIVAARANRRLDSR